LGLFPDTELPAELRDAFQNGSVTVELKFARPIPSATLRIAKRYSEFSPGIARSLDDRRAGGQLFHRFEPPQRHGVLRDRKGHSKNGIDETTIGYRTLHAVGKLLRL